MLAAFLLTLIERRPVKSIGTSVPIDGNEEVIVWITPPLRLQNANEAHDPFPMPAKVIIPASSKLGGMQVVFICNGKEQTTIASPVLNERSNIQAQMEGSSSFRTCG